MSLVPRHLHPTTAESPTETLYDSQYRRLFDEHPRAMWLCDARSFVFLDVNDAAVCHFGYTRDEFLSMSLRDLCAPEDFPALIARAGEDERNSTGECGVDAAAARPSVVVAARFNKKDGSIVDVEVTLRALLFGGKRALLTVADDVTKRRRAEESLRESERRYRALVEQASDGIFICDERGQYIQVNATGCQMLGYTEAELLRLNLRDVIDDADLALRPLRLSDVVAGATVKIERTFRRKDGTLLDGEISASRLDDGRVQSTLRDISEHKRVKAELEAAATELRALFAVIPDIILVFDAEGRYLKVAPTNPSLQFKSAAKVIGKRLHDVFPQTKADEFLGYVRDALRLKCTVEIEYNSEVEGRTRWFAGAVSPVSDETVIWVVRDVTEHRQFEHYLLQSEERYRELFENANDIVYTHDLAGRFTSLNKTGERITGYTREEAMTLNIAHVIAPEDLERARRMIARKEAEETSTVYELTLIAKDGRRVSLEVSTRLLYKDGQPSGVQGIARDISERKRAERERQHADSELRDSQERYRNLVENAKDIIYTTDLAGRYTSLNKTGEIVSGYTLAEIMEMSLADIVAPDHVERSQQMLSDKISGSEKTVYEVDIISKEGRRVQLEVSTRLIYEHGRPAGVQGIARDITERKKVEAQLLHDAFHDALTGLPNRAFFMDRLELAVARAQTDVRFKFAILFFDLDRFKVVNDSLGHTIGDHLLVNVGRRLQSALRPGDTVARLGGDEYIVLLEGFDDERDVLRVVERMQKQIGRAFKLGAHELFATTSIGVVLSETGHASAEDYLRNADIAMHRAKSLGKARYQVFDREMHLRALELMQLEIDLRRAIERHEFVVHYQPVVSLRSGRVMAFEALVRWQHPVHGLVQPDTFIPLAEETGMIEEIDRMVMAIACRQMRAWQQKFYTATPLRVSVNVSAKQFANPGLIESVTEILEDSGLDPQCLIIEITESLLISNVESVATVLARLKELQVGIYLDDFGTGYSSLNYLHRFPFDALKIDRSFVNRISEDEKNQAIAQAIVTLAHSLGLYVIAEGLETTHQLAQLRKLTCEYGQGYIFNAPVDARRAERWLAAKLEGGGALTEDEAELASR